MRDAIEATGDGNAAARVDGLSPGQRPSVDADFDAADFFARFDTPEATNAAGSHHLFQSDDGGYQTFTQRNASLRAIYVVKRAGLFTTDDRAPRPDEALPRTGREVRVGDGPTGSARVAKEFDDLKMTATDTLDDFRGLGKLGAWYQYAVPR